VCSSDLSTVGKDFARPGVVHRLDRDTSGVIVFAKSDEAHWKLATQFEKRTVDKRYLALVEGDVEPRADLIDLPIGPHPSREKGYREKYVVRHDELGKPSVTIYRVVEAFEGYCLVEVELKTGRTHQIRVHMTHRGWPLVGDDMYGGKRIAPKDLGAGEELLSASPDPWEQPGLLMGRQALHAATLTFRHPITGETMVMQAPVPADFLRTVNAMRRVRPGEGRIAMDAATLDLDVVVPHDPAPHDPTKG
ncbi:MAG: RluA family pseudouridine synthase, partial [Phycisphaerales bacterium]